jgi:hypothetical protein
MNIRLQNYGANAFIRPAFGMQWLSSFANDDSGVRRRARDGIERAW